MIIFLNTTILGLLITRSEENGGNLNFSDYIQLEEAFGERVSKLCMLTNVT